MKFKKLGENKIQCFISKQEMWEMGVEAHDFIGHRDRTEELLHDVLEEAKFEFDISHMGPYLSVQMTIMPEGDLSMVISAASNPMEGTLAGFLLRLRALGEALATEDEPEEQESAKAAPQELQAEVSITDLQSILQEEGDHSLWLQLVSLDDCIALARCLSKGSPACSHLYKYRGDYFMFVQCSSNKYKAAAQLLCISEHSLAVFLPDEGGEFIMEHGSCICCDDAVEKLAQMQ